MSENPAPARVFRGGYPFIPYRPERVTDAEMLRRTSDLAKTLHRRRSVRDFAPDPVPRDVILEAIRAAGSAPSGANMQPWSFVLVGDPETKRLIREGAEREEKESYERRMPDAWLRALAPFQTDWRKEFLEIAPWLIVVFKADYHVASGGERVLHYYVNESVGLACGMLLAALHLAGLATLTHTPSPMGFLRTILERPENEKPYLLIPVGHAAEAAMVPDIQRKPVEQILTVR